MHPLHVPRLHVPRRLVGATAAACTAALAPAVAVAAPSSPAAFRGPASASRCTTSELVVWLNVPPGNHYAGGAYYYLEFTNLSGHACTLRGYPGVSAVSLSGRALGSPAGWGVVPPATVMLASGATATAGVQIADPGDFGDRCLLPGPPPGPGRPGQVPTAAGLRVYPPSQYVSTEIPYPFPACAHPGPVYIHAGPVMPGLPE
jgi:hypothetical protein